MLDARRLVEEALKNTDFQQIYQEIKDRSDKEQIVTEGAIIRVISGAGDNQLLYNSFVGYAPNRAYYRRVIEIMIEFGLLEMVSENRVFRSFQVYRVLEQ